MKKYFITYNQSLALKKLGFDEPCLAYYNEYEHFIIEEIESSLGNNKIVSSPLKQQVFEWFSQEYNKLPVIDHSSINGWYFVIREIGGTIDPMLKAVSVGNFKTYKEAESACIDKLIDIIKV